MKRTKRSTAFAALWVWAFVLASGMANACLLGAPGTRSDTHSHAAEIGSGTAHAHAPSVDPEGAAGRGGDDRHVPGQSCLKVCDDGSKTPIKVQAGFELTDPGTAPLVATAWNEAPSAVSARHRTDALQPGFVGPPFRVRYSRLAL